MKKARCKFTCTGVTRHSWPGQTVKLQTQYDDKIPEDQKFSTATPSGSMEMTINNPALEGFFEPGKNYYIDVIPVEAES